MPNKYAQKKKCSVPKQKHKVVNWTDYSQALRERGNREIWISDKAITNWYPKERVYDGTGSPVKFTDFAIITCHEVRQVYKLLLRQAEGFINSVFSMKNLPITCPGFSYLSKRLSTLNIKSPRYEKTDKPDETTVAIAIDSTELKRFGRDEWHEAKHKVSDNRSWRKIHIAVGDDHIIHDTALTDKFASDDSVIDNLIEQIDVPVNHATADGSLR